MTESIQSLPLFVSLLLLLASARMFGEIFERFKQPAMIGEIFGGILLGPTILGWVTYTDDLKVISDLAVLMLIIYAGLEIDIERFKDSLKGKGFWIAILGFFIPFLSGILIGLLFGLDNNISLFLGICIAITALPVSVRILMDLGKLNTTIGDHILSAAVANDVFSLLILGIIINFTQGNFESWDSIIVQILISLLKISIFLFILALAYKLFKYARTRLIDKIDAIDKVFSYLKEKESVFAFALIFVLIFAALAEMAGLHFVVGAFFGAVLIPRDLIKPEKMKHVQNSVSGITMGFLAPIFFALIGVEFNISSINNVWLLLAVLAFSFISKVIGGYWGGRIARYPKYTSLTIGFGLNARGIMELVIANIALSQGFIDLSLFSILVIMGVFTTIFTPVLLKQGFNWVNKKEKLYSST